MGLKLETQPIHSDAGFTLIELLVSLAILAVLAIAAVLSLPRGAAPSDRDMALFQIQFSSTRQRAITGHQSLGLALSLQGLRRAEKLKDGWQFSTQLQRWQGPVHLVPSDRAAASDTPEIILLATGQTSAFHINFGSGGRCESDGWTGLTCQSN
ncbi:prepilin-type N-terminal cleavage/methylation domain-containing protein (plasmid) [Parasedimentitalea marina]|uniref:Prepilin-type N-terminal cleavage/methylation domain-containing protein n=1 Tax=Parasedimentitalea marina TaxID=2483033 RepID=A0A3T0N9M2_9RHOB|nr:prepilin-type N-terminal cleavage/methylation domain-containing protein [Parasedimentitalea marina]AZV80665.1 prepilin-type N-terminal cleavage/methylation domain-containing protein [Parasedimentitalea marina]